MPKILLSKEQSDFEDALSLVALNYTAQRQAIKAPAAVIKEFGQLFAVTQDEVDQLSALRDLIVRHVLERSPARPLCLAVFGPPGIQRLNVWIHKPPKPIGRSCRGFRKHSLLRIAESADARSGFSVTPQAVCC